MRNEISLRCISRIEGNKLASIAAAKRTAYFRCASIGASSDENTKARCGFADRSGPFSTRAKLMQVLG